MGYQKLSSLAILFMILKTGTAQTQTATITQSGWYRIAINGPLVQGAGGGNRAAARFILRDVTSSLHQTVEFLAYYHFSQKPSIVVLNNSYYRSGAPPFAKLRIIKGGVYDGAAVEVYVNILAPYPNNEAYYLQDNDQVSGWTAVNWQLISTSSGDNDGVPQGFSAYVMTLQDMVNGFVTDHGLQYSNYNGNFYTSGNILLGKTTQTNSAYKLDVNGNIRANKVVVNTTGADYVFDSAFSLIPMDSLRRFIAAYHHLPDIPSASKLQASGLDVGEMQKLQLQKIEELTLYIMDLDKRLAQQDAKMIELEKRLTRGKNENNE